MPAVPVCLLEPIWQPFVVLLPERPTGAPTHPLGRHRRRVPDRVVFEHVVVALVHGSGDGRIASPGRSDRTVRRRLRERAAAGLAATLHAPALEQVDRMFGLDVAGLAVGGCIAQAPGGGEQAGRSPVDRGKQGLKRATVTDAAGVPLHLVSAGANRHDAPLLGPTLAGLAKLASPPPDGTAHLDRGDAGASTQARLAEFGFAGAIARKGVPAPLQAGKRRVVERTQSWMDGDGKLRRCTEKSGRAVDSSLSWPRSASVSVTAYFVLRLRGLRSGSVVLSRPRLPPRFRSRKPRVTEH